MSKVVLPSALPGITTGVLLAVARAAGETAPLILTALGAYNIVTALVGEPISALPLAILSAAPATPSRPARPGRGRVRWSCSSSCWCFTISARMIASRSQHLIDEHEPPDHGSGPLKRASRSRTWTCTTAAPALKACRPWTSAPAEITAIIGPSGCGKSTLIRCLQPHERPGPRGGRVRRGALPRRGHLRAGVDPVVVRRHIGMVFQRPNPFPKSIYDNVAFGAKHQRLKGELDELVERCFGARRSGTR